MKKDFRQTINSLLVFIFVSWWKKDFQRTINLLVVFMFVSWWVLPFVQSFLPYEDETIPDETIALDEKITELLLTIDPNFEDLYNNQSIEKSLELTYLTQPRILLSNQENYTKSVKSIVYITTEDADGLVSSGSGSILTTNGIIMTNYHGIEGATKVVVTTYSGVNYTVEKVLSSNEVLDIAFIKIDAENLSPLPIGNSDSVQIGDNTLVIGHPEGFLNTLSLGNVSGFRTYKALGKQPQLQITNPISGGNSGGVVLNEYGEIIGIPTWSMEYDQNIVQVQNLNFAIPINEAIELLNLAE